MSRCGRTQDFLNDWKDGEMDHLDAWQVANALDSIDPFFRRDEIKQLKKQLQQLEEDIRAAGTMRIEQLVSGERILYPVEH